MCSGETSGTVRVQWWTLKRETGLAYHAWVGIPIVRANRIATLCPL